MAGEMVGGETAVGETVVRDPGGVVAGVEIGEICS